MSQAGAGSAAASSTADGQALAVSKPGGCERRVIIGPKTYVINHSWRLGSDRGVQLKNRRTLPIYSTLHSKQSVIILRPVFELFSGYNY